MKTLGEQLLSKNQNIQGKEDTVELALISFDGGVSNRISGTWTTSRDTFNNAVDGLRVHRGTDWEDALKSALEIATTKIANESNETTFVIFFTDGEASQYTNFHGQGNLNAQPQDAWYNDYSDHNDTNATYGRYFSYFLCRETMKDEARAIVNAGAKLYGVYAYNSSPDTYNGESGQLLLHNAIKYGYDTSANLQDSYFYDVSKSEDLTNAFANILKAINSFVGFDDIVMNDSMTRLTSAGVSMVAGATSPTGFRYTRSGGTYGEGENWAGAPTATYSEEEGVQWDLGSTILEDGVTYTLSFTVWPKQEAYDWVADLNNGIKTWTDVVNANMTEYFVDNNGVYEVVTNPPSFDSNNTPINNIITYTKIQTDVVDTLPSDVTVGVPIVDEENGTTTTYTANGDGTYTKKVETEKTTAFNPPDQNMGLEDTVIDVTKEWTSSLDDKQMVSFLYYTYDDPDHNIHKGDSKKRVIPFNILVSNGTPSLYQTINLGWSETAGEYVWATDDTTVHNATINDDPTEYKIGTYWKDEMNIATGVMLSYSNAVARGIDISDTTKYHRVTYGEGENQKVYYILETGHDYNIEEPHDLEVSYQFDFITETYHPMVVDGKLKSVIINGDKVERIIPDDGELSSLTGRNVLRGGINIYKKIIPPNASADTVLTGTDIPDDVFTFTVLLENDSPVFVNDEEQNRADVPWYSVNGFYYHNTTTGEYGNNGAGMTGNILTESSDHKSASVTISITAKDEIRIANVPAGTIYTIKEVTDSLPYGYEFARVEASIGEGESTIPFEGTITNETIVGEIVPNAANNVTYYNRQLQYYEVIIKKTDENGNPLAGAHFDLYTAEEYAKEQNEAGTGTPMKRDLISSSDEDTLGEIQIGRLIEGKYYLVETEAPNGYILLASPIIISVNPSSTVTTGEGEDAIPLYVTYEQAGNQASTNNTGITVTTKKLQNNPNITIYVYTLKVTNTSGVELPETGGPGKAWFFILGGILVAGAAGALLLMRKRNKAA